MEKIKIQPVLVGGDINCYSVARAYHEAYGVKSIAFGKMLLGATKDSNIIDFRIDPNMGNKDEFIKVLLKTADELEVSFSHHKYLLQTFSGLFFLLL